MKGPHRRHFIGIIVSLVMAFIGWILGTSKKAVAGWQLRPPGALPEEEFLKTCVRCFKCSDVCPNSCIQLYGPEDGLKKAFTPYIEARARACILCGKCTEVCPSGALQPFAANREGWKEGVSMGLARVNEAMCYSYHGRTCGACYRACPLAGEAMKIGVFETPIVQDDVCVGCGLCEQACLHLPQAIRVIPRST